jgi:hypothetical protein
MSSTNKENQHLNNLQCISDWTVAQRRKQIRDFCLFATEKFGNLNIVSSEELDMYAFSYLVQLYNGNVPPRNNLNKQYKKNTLTYDTLLRYLKAYNRGEYETWEGLNDLTSQNCKLKKILHHVDSVLKNKFPSHAKYNELNKSKFRALAWGVLAREFTPAGTFLGHVDGESITSTEAEKRINEECDDNENVFMSKKAKFFVIGQDHFVDLSQYDSCYARYYNCVPSKFHNVSVQLLSIDTSRRTMGFITNQDVNKGEEFLIDFNSILIVSEAKKEVCRSTSFDRVCETIKFELQSR